MFSGNIVILIWPVSVGGLRGTECAHLSFECAGYGIHHENVTCIRLIFTEGDKKNIYIFNRKGKHSKKKHTTNFASRLLFLFSTKHELGWLLVVGVPAVLCALNDNFA